MSERAFGVPPPLPKPIEWYFAIDGQSNGPVSGSEIQSLFNEGIINIGTQVWREGFSDWKILSETELAAQTTSEQLYDESDEGDQFRYITKHDS